MMLRVRAANLKGSLPGYLLIETNCDGYMVQGLPFAEVRGNGRIFRAEGQKRQGLRYSQESFG